MSIQMASWYLIFAFTIPIIMHGQVKEEPIRIGVAGLTHTHVHWILGRADRGDIEIVGIAEPNRNLAQRYAEQHGYAMDKVYPTLEAMIKATSPEAVTAFGTIREHLEVVETCAPLGIHVMVEKPLAVNFKHAKKMAKLAKKYKIHLLTNYETTWYASNQFAYDLLQNGELGELRKIEVYDGHPGPVEIGINPEFLEWLIDPYHNGAGALTDFGCYGANLITWLQKGLRPTSVTAVTHTNKPEIYPMVDDEASVILQYPKSQGIIQASWNWPVSRKDMVVYGKTGQIYCDYRNQVRFQLSEQEPVKTESLPERLPPYDDPFAFFAAVIKGAIQVSPYDLSSLENNLIVVEILQAAKKSAKKGKTIELE